MTKFEMQVKTTALEAAEKAAKIVLDNLGKIKSGGIETKRQFDFVTHVDLESERTIIETIRQQFPDHDFHAEEQGEDARTSEFQWIIDPLDGTTNYIHNFPCFCISIALQKNGETLFGLVLDPLRNECFSALKGEGAFSNEAPISVSTETDFSRALIATGFPFRDKSKMEVYLSSFAEVMRNVAGIRRAGSAAIDLCYVASGRLDGFWEIGLHAWDIAAGILILSEAGGVTTDFIGEKNYFKTGNVVAANLNLHPELLAICKDKLAGVYMP